MLASIYDCSMWLCVASRVRISSGFKSHARVRQHVIRGFVGHINTAKDILGHFFDLNAVDGSKTRFANRTHAIEYALEQLRTSGNTIPRTETS